MSVGRIASQVVAVAAPGESVRVAAHRMAVNYVGTLVVVDTQDPSQPVGMLTDRDIAVRCVAGELDPDEVHLPGIFVQRVLPLNPEQAAEKRIELLA